MHNSLLVISALGEDRPGLVDGLTRLVADAGCNIEDSRMTVLGGEFAAIVLVSGRWNQLAKLEATLPSLERRLSLTVQTRRTARSRRGGELLPYAVEVVCMDQGGVVHQLSNFFSVREIDIRDLATTTYTAVYTGTPMFSVRMTVDVPARMQIARLREEFMDFCDELNLDAIIEPAKA
ncbi:glycine cleavage system protein R [Arhodomonas sp. KWT]|uniref:glycine cleavage system protein R n=1 Tax=Arhodomonas sp. KWT TaxID=2679915 RepID=UPI0013D0427B|nr:ACT domain-containing protein [Arhodomonas sp. KWT]